MSKGARTLAELDRAVSILRTRDCARARELKALRADLAAIEQMLADDRATLLRMLSDSPLPAANSTPTSSHSRRVSAGAGVWQRLRSFFR